MPTPVAIKSPNILYTYMYTLQCIYQITLTKWKCQSNWSLIHLRPVWSSLSLSIVNYDSLVPMAIVQSDFMSLFNWFMYIFHFRFTLSIFWFSINWITVFNWLVMIANYSFIDWLFYRWKSHFIFINSVYELKISFDLSNYTWIFPTRNYYWNKLRSNWWVELWLDIRIQRLK